MTIATFPLRTGVPPAHLSARMQAAVESALYEGMSGRFVTDLRDAVYAGLEATR